MARAGGAPENLKPFKKGDPRAAEMQAKGTKVRLEKNRQMKDMRESANRVLKLAIKRGDMISLDEVKSIAESEDINIPVADMINIVMAQRALLGDVQAAIFIRDMSGQKPSDKVEIDQSLTVEAWAKKHKVKL